MMVQGSSYVCRRTARRNEAHPVSGEPDVSAEKTAGETSFGLSRDAPAASPRVLLFCSRPRSDAGGLQAVMEAIETELDRCSIPRTPGRARRAKYLVDAAALACTTGGRGRTQAPDSSGSAPRRGFPDTAGNGDQPLPSRRGERPLRERRPGILPAPAPVLRLPSDPVAAWQRPVPPGPQSTPAPPEVPSRVGCRHGRIRHDGGCRGEGSRTWRRHPRSAERRRHAVLERGRHCGEEPHRGRRAAHACEGLRCARRSDLARPRGASPHLRRRSGADCARKARSGARRRRSGAPSRPGGSRDTPPGASRGRRLRHALAERRHAARTSRSDGLRGSSGGFWRGRDPADRVGGGGVDCAARRRRRPGGRAKRSARQRHTRSAAGRRGSAWNASRRPGW